MELYNDKIGSYRKDIETQNGLVNNKRGLYPDGAKYVNYSFYTLHHIAYQNWKVEAGLRYNAFSIQVTDT